MNKYNSPWSRDNSWNLRENERKILEENNIKNMIIQKLWSMLKQYKSEVDKFYTSQAINITLNLKHLEKEEKSNKIPQSE